MILGLPIFCHVDNRKKENGRKDKRNFKKKEGNFTEALPFLRAGYMLAFGFHDTL